MDALEASCDTLPGLVTEAEIADQSSKKYPGYLEAVHADGRVVETLSLPPALPNRTIGTST